MRRSGQVIAGAAVLAALTLPTAAAAGASQAGATQAKPSLHAVLNYKGTRAEAVKPTPGDARYAAPANHLSPGRPTSGTTIPTWSSSVVAGQNGDTYGFTMVGNSNPFAGGAGTTSVPAQVIPVIVTDGSSHDVYDPTTANAGCGESQSPLTGMFNSPLLQRHRWSAGGQYVGTGQYIDAQMREEFWSATNRFGVSPGFHLLLNGSEPAVITATFNGGSEVNPGTCNELEEFPMSTWDSFIQGEFPTLASFGVNSTTFPFFLFKNVVFTTTDNTGTHCCVIGYHSAFNSGGNTQTYGNGDYITDGEFGGITDIAAISHEVGEWANDPFVNNPTPPWGHIGQQPNCQGNLEVGDPLTGTDFAVSPFTVRGGPTYHLQELAFFGWFYDDNIGVNGWYSTRGTFTSGSSLCS